MTITINIKAANGATSSVSLPDPIVNTTTGYNNLTNWASSANRPKLSGSVLSWAGPVAGGPSTSNDAIMTKSLISKNNDITTNADNQLIEGLNMPNNNIIVRHNNVIIRRSNISLVLYTAGSGILVEDNLLNGIDGTSNGIVKNMTIRRNSFHDNENMITKYIVNCTIVDNWFHRASGADCDMIEFYASSGNCLVQHNTFDGRDFVSGFLNSGVNLTNWQNTPNAGNANVSGITLNNNAFLKAGTYFNICDDSNQGAGVVNFTCTNNGFYGSLAYRRNSANGGTIATNSGNFIMASPADINGQLCNSTGKI